MIQCNSEYNTNCHGYVGLSEKNDATQCIFLNHRPIRCPLILKLIRIGFKESLDFSLYPALGAPDLRDKNIFILFFLTFPQTEYAFVNENGKRFVMFSDLQKILNNIKHCTFKHFTEKTIVRNSTAYLYEAPLLKETYVKSERSILNNSISKHKKNVTSLTKKHKIVMISVKREKIVTNYSSKQHNEIFDVKTNNCYIKKGNNTLNNTHCQVDIVSAKCTKSSEDKVTEKTYNDIDKVQANSADLAITNNFPESNKLCHFLNSNDNDFVNIISPLSEWSNWTYCTKNKEHESVKNIYDMFSKNGIRYQQFSEYTKQFDFLPRKLHGLLQHRRAKLTNVNCFNSPNSTISRK